MIYEKISGFSDEISPDTTKQFTVLNKLNIKYFEPRCVNGKNISELNDEEVTNLKEQMKSFGISVSSLGSPIGKIKVSDDFAPHFELYKRVVKIAKMLDCKFIRIFSFYNDGGSWTPFEKAEVFKKLAVMLDYAQKEGVVLLHENEKNIYGDNISRCKEIMEEFYCDNFGMVFDPANFVQTGVNTVEAFDSFKNYITYMHIKDALSESGKVTPAGMGDGNVEYILKNLFDMGYNGFLSLEPHMGSFVGLEDLELNDDMLKLPKGGEGTFTIAYNSLVKVLENIKRGK